MTDPDQTTTQPDQGAQAAEGEEKKQYFKLEQNDDGSTSFVADKSQFENAETLRFLEAFGMNGGNLLESSDYAPEDIEVLLNSVAKIVDGNISRWNNLWEREDSVSMGNESLASAGNTVKVDPTSGEPIVEVDPSAPAPSRPEQQQALNDTGPSPTNMLG